jgi:endogenous inhibitor of DNA gyrase (YacG/DUF329 family)
MYHSLMSSCIGVDVGHWVLTNKEITWSQSLSDQCQKLDHRYWTNKGLLVKD